MGKEMMYEDKEFEDKVRMILACEITINESGLDFEEVNDSNYQQIKYLD